MLKLIAYLAPLQNLLRYCLLPIAYCLLHIAYCLLLLPIAYCLLPIAYCLLPIAYCLLPIAYCLLVPKLLLPGQHTARQVLGIGKSQGV